MSTSSSWESYLSPHERDFYNQCFRAVSLTRPGIVTGGEAVTFFATSGVPTPILSDIWETVDRDNLGYLTSETFSIALKLIACTQHGVTPAEPVLATQVPLPQFEAIKPEAPKSPAITTPIIDPASTITPTEREKYYSIFRIHQPAGGVLDAENAKSIFRKSRLPTETLGKIWDLADVRKSGNLNEAEFAVAMHYIAKLMDGTITSLPQNLPPTIYATVVQPQRSQTIDSLGSMAFSASNDRWNLSPQEKIQYDAFFDKIDTQHTGFVQGAEAVEFFRNSRLPEGDLAQIWDLADSNQQGRLTRDSFAVAMHLIHRRLKGEPLPTSLPNGLNPTSASPAITPAAALPAQQSPAMAAAHPAHYQRQQQHSSSVHSPLATGGSVGSNQQDLLGDFGESEKVTNDVNQVNQLQNQMGSLSVQTTQIQHQKLDVKQTLEQLAKQKQELQAQLVQIQQAHETELKELQELQQQVENEKPGWIQTQQEYEAAKQQLVAIKNDIAQLRNTLESGRAESEQLRRSAREIQEETTKLNSDLNALREQVKQQEMMLDINRRQVTASEQDRDQARRDLADFKEERNLPNEIPELDKITEGHPGATAVSPSEPVANNANFFDIFSPKSGETPKITDEKKDSASDFDAIFGSAVSSSSSPPPRSSPLDSAFDPFSWTSIPEQQIPSSPPELNRSSRPAPPPPPPQSRHHRQISDSHASITSTSTTATATKKNRAPPPPPPAAANKSTEKTIDDFDAAFSGPLSDAQVIQEKSDFDGFDDAFTAFHKSTGPEDGKKPVTSTNLNWASDFGGFDFGQSDSNNTGKKKEESSDDWDSIFGGSGSGPVKTAENKDVFGFEDAFSNFDSAAAATATA
ncbi:hypothetical protein BX666DRAFT_1884006, partial [Dichotomocladium elegans]